MSYVVYRTDEDGAESVVGCTDEAWEIGVIIDEDRGNIDWEAQYRVTREERE